MTFEEYCVVRTHVIGAGYERDILWAENLHECESAWDFFSEYVYVVINSGMKNQVARVIYNRVMLAMVQGEPVYDVFGHEKKCEAIMEIQESVRTWFRAWKGAGTEEERLRFLETLPHIGPVTKYHLAKNLGMDICKPDRHLVRIAGDEGPQALCERLSRESGDRVCVVDTVLWRAANLGMV